MGVILLFGVVLFLSSEKQQSQQISAFNSTLDKTIFYGSATNKEQIYFKNNFAEPLILILAQPKSLAEKISQIKIYTKNKLQILDNDPVISIKQDGNLEDINLEMVYTSSTKKTSSFCVLLPQSFFQDFSEEQTLAFTEKIKNYSLLDINYSQTQILEQETATKLTTFFNENQELNLSETKKTNLILFEDGHGISDSEKLLYDSIINLKQSNPVEYYLQEGKQTQITSYLQNIANNQIEKGPTDFETLNNVLKWVYHFATIPANQLCGSNNCCTFDSDCPQGFPLKVSVTADVIAHKINYQSCHDYALLFVTLLRAKDIPAKFVQTVDEAWLNSALYLNKIGKDNGGSFIEVTKKGGYSASYHINDVIAGIEGVGQCSNTNVELKISNILFQDEKYAVQLDLFCNNIKIGDTVTHFVNDFLLADSLGQYTKNSSMVNHGITEIFINNNWQIIDPQLIVFNPPTNQSNPTDFMVIPKRTGNIVKSYGDNMQVIMGEDLDAWALGWHSISDIISATKTTYFKKEKSGVSSEVFDKFMDLLDVPAGLINGSTKSSTEQDANSEAIITQISKNSVSNDRNELLQKYPWPDKIEVGLSPNNPTVIIERWVVNQNLTDPFVTDSALPGSIQINGKPVNFNVNSNIDIKILDEENDSSEFGTEPYKLKITLSYSDFFSQEQDLPITLDKNIQLDYGLFGKGLSPVIELKINLNDSGVILYAKPELNSLIKDYAYKKGWDMLLVPKIDPIKFLDSELFDINYDNKTYTLKNGNTIEAKFYDAGYGYTGIFVKGGNISFGIVSGLIKTIPELGAKFEVTGDWKLKVSTVRDKSDGFYVDPNPLFKLRSKIISQYAQKPFNYLFIVADENEIPMEDEFGLIPIKDPLDTKNEILDNAIYGNIDSDPFLELSVGRLPSSDYNYVSEYFLQNLKYVPPENPLFSFIGNYDTNDPIKISKEQVLLYYPFTGMSPNKNYSADLQGNNNLIFKPDVDKFNEITDRSDYITVLTHGTPEGLLYDGNALYKYIPKADKQIMIVATSCSTSSEFGKNVLIKNVRNYFGGLQITYNGKNEFSLTTNQKPRITIGAAYRDYINGALIDVNRSFEFILYGDPSNLIDASNLEQSSKPKTIFSENEVQIIMPSFDVSTVLAYLSTALTPNEMAEMSKGNFEEETVHLNMPGQGIGFGYVGSEAPLITPSILTFFDCPIIKLKGNSSSSYPNNQNSAMTYEIIPSSVVATYTDENKDPFSEKLILVPTASDDTNRILVNSKDKEIKKIGIMSYCADVETVISLGISPEMYYIGNGTTNVPFLYPQGTDFKQLDSFFSKIKGFKVKASGSNMDFLDFNSDFIWYNGDFRVQLYWSYADWFKLISAGAEKSGIEIKIYS